MEILLENDKTCKTSYISVAITLPMPELILHSYTPADLEPLAHKLLDACKSARIFAFFGKLGAGKTAFIQQICKLLGVKEAVTSPTFNLVNEYRGESAMIYHFDFYRIRTEVEAYDLGADEYFDSGHYVFIEWPERIPTLLPEEAVEVRLNVNEDKSRKITLSY
ncbi:MAG: tRNA (adenosine(37)-N6)-threonylcarbamoyltransferase complex ATPase subunit type 1 TsaE [Bacteroidota bacterium]